MNSFTSENSIDVLDDLPKLNAWFVNQRKTPSMEYLSEFHLWNIVKALKSPSNSQCRIWVNSAELILDAAPSMLNHVLEADSFAITMGKPLTDLYSILAEAALRNGEGEKAFKTLQKMADKTGLAAFRFLSAWTAFNNEDIEICISECDKVSEPFAPLHTLMGQAFLEHGHTSEAIESLKIAIKIAPSDPLPRVQLIKAYLVTGLQKEAMRHVDECHKLVGDHIEIACLAALTVLAGPNHQQDFCERTLKQFGRHLHTDPSDIETFSIAMDLAINLDRKDWGSRYSATFEIKTPQNLQTLTLKISNILKKTGERQWHDVARTIIDKTLVVTRGGFPEIGFTQ